MNVNRPTYQRVADEIRGRLLGGDFGDRGQLPTEAEVARLYAVSRQTVRRAFQELVNDGLVERTAGRGTFARPPGELYVRQLGSVEDLMALSQDTSLRVVRALATTVDVTSAGRLRLDSDVVGSLAFVRSHRGVDLCLTRVCMNPADAATLADVPEFFEIGAVSQATVIGLLDQRLPAPITHAEQSITVENADQKVAAALDVGVGHPMLRIDRLYLNAAETPVELATSWFLPEHYSYRTRLRRTR